MDIGWSRQNARCGIHFKQHVALMTLAERPEVQGSVARCSMEPRAEVDVSDSSRKVLTVVLSLACLAGAVRIGMPVWDYLWASLTAVGRASPSAADPYARSADLVALLKGQSAGPALDGKFPCLLASVTNSIAEPQLTQCDLPIQHSGPTDQFEVDLRYGNFILRQSDLYISDVFDVPLTRTYSSGDHLHSNSVHAFGRNTNHPFDISPVGSRFPYTYQMLVLEDGNFLYFPRVSQGTDYWDAIYQHTEHNLPRPRGCYSGLGLLNG